MTSVEASPGEPISGRAAQAVRTRARILEMARPVFEAIPFADVTIADIAERAGVSRGLVYHYFPSKQAVFRELAVSVHGELVEALDQVLDRESTTPLVQRIENAVRAGLTRNQRDARIISVIDEVARYDAEVADLRDRVQQAETERLAQLIIGLQQIGRADARLDPWFAAAAIQAMTWHLSERWFVRGSLSFDIEDGTQQLTTIIINALKLAPTVS